MSNKKKTVFCCLVVLIVSYFTYFHTYYEPDKAFYDEFYYIVHAEKYIQGIVFFDVNPPLGKMFIALGEKMFNPNKNIDFREPSENRLLVIQSAGFSFVGVRFFPSLFGFLNGLLLFLIFYRVSKNNILSLIFTFLYLFENSSIASFRAAMIDSTLVFFSFLTILYFLHLYEKEDDKTALNYFLLGCLTSLATSTKMVGFILAVLFVFLLFKGSKKIVRLLKLSGAYLAGLCVVFLCVYYVHTALGTRLLDKDVATNELGVRTGIKSLVGMKVPSVEYIKMVEKKDIYNPLKLVIPLRDYFNFMKASQVFLPKYDRDPEKDTKLGSRPLGWLIGVKSMNYAYYSSFDGDEYWYMFFQANPVNWALGLLGVVFSIGLIFSRLVFRVKISNSKTYSYILIFTTLYVGYMIAVSFIAMQRILFITTYLLPLFFSFILFVLIFNYVFESYIIKRDRVLYIAVFLLALQSFYVYRVSSPVAYGKFVSYLGCEKTRLVSFWEDLCHR